ncbi:MAG: YggT family protein [SAR202 cluster bacterium]|nr:YggT family protein [SAR202 cluster bacterium]
MTSYLAQFINLLFTALSLAIFGRVIMSWISPNGEDNISQFLDQITEPILAPIRKIVPPLGMFDLTPMIALIVLQMVRPHIVNLIHGGF